jgi:hypothetical protein
VKKASTIFHVVLGIEGIVLILRTPQLIASLTGEAGFGGAWLVEFWRNLAGRMDAGMPLLGMCALITAWGLMAGKRWARRSGVFLSWIHVFMFPYFTPAGLLGLYACRRKRDFATLDTRWQEPVPASVLPGAFRMLAALSITMMTASLYLLIRHSQEHPVDLVPAWLLPPVMALIYGLLGILHDLGHWLSGRISGFDFGKLTVGPLEFHRSLPSGWSIHRRNRTVWRYLEVGARAKRLDRLDSRLVVLQLGGPLGEFLIGVISFAALSAVSQPLMREILGLVALLACGRFIMELALLRDSNEDFTDGARLVQLWNRDPEGQRWCALHSIAQSQTEPVAPKEWQESWVIRLSADPESPVYAAGCYYAYAYYLDNDNIEKAEEYIERLRGIKGWHHEERVAVEVAFFEAFTNQRSPAAASQIHLADHHSHSSAAARRMEAMSLVSDGYSGEAARKIEESRKDLGAGGWAIFEKRLLGEVEKRLQENRARANTVAVVDDLPSTEFAELIRRTAM